MDIDDNLLGFMQDVRGSLGRIEERVNNTNDHLKAVNVKLNGHLVDPDAHPAASRSTLKTALGITGVLLSLVGVAIALAKALG